MGFGEYGFLMNSVILKSGWFAFFKTKFGESGPMEVKGSGNEHWLKELIKGPVKSLNTNAEEVQSGAVYIICFCIFYCRTFTCILSSKTSRPGRMLNFTEIHR